MNMSQTPLPMAWFAKFAIMYVYQFLCKWFTTKSREKPSQTFIDAYHNQTLDIQLHDDWQNLEI